MFWESLRNSVHFALQTGIFSQKVVSFSVFLLCSLGIRIVKIYSNLWYPESRVIVYNKQAVSKTLSSPFKMSKPSSSPNFPQLPVSSPPYYCSPPSRDPLSPSQKCIFELISETTGRIICSSPPWSRLSYARGAVQPILPRMTTASLLLAFVLLAAVSIGQTYKVGLILYSSLLPTGDSPHPLPSIPFFLGAPLDSQRAGWPN